MWFSYFFWQLGVGGPEKWIRNVHVQKSRTRKIKETWKIFSSRVWIFKIYVLLELPSTSLSPFENEKAKISCNDPSFVSLSLLQGENQASEHLQKVFSIIDKKTCKLLRNRTECSKLFLCSKLTLRDILLIHVDTFQLW